MNSPFIIISPKPVASLTCIYSIILSLENTIMLVQRKYNMWLVCIFFHWLIDWFSARLDGTSEKMRQKLDQHTSIEDWLELGDTYSKKDDGKKRVNFVQLIHFSQLLDFKKIVTMSFYNINFSLLPGYHCPYWIVFFWLSECELWWKTSLNFDCAL